MGTYLVRRLIGIPPLILGITLITFILIHLTPGSPVDHLKLNPGLRPEDLEHIKQTLGIDRPLPAQYLGWITQLARGDLGISLTTYQPVRHHIVERLPNTLLLTGCALVFALGGAVPLGVLAAVKRNSAVDHLARIVATLGQAVPSFWLGLVLIVVFAVHFKARGLPSLPSGGAQTLPHGGDVLDRIRHLLLPMLTLGFAQLAGWIRYIRAQMIEVLQADYVRTARAKGLSERTVVLRHALRNAVLPLITLVGLTIPNLFGGAVIIETIFAWPGLGSLAIDAAGNRDYTMVMGIVLVISVITVLANLVADLLYQVADPRIHYT